MRSKVGQAIIRIRPQAAGRWVARGAIRVVGHTPPGRRADRYRHPRLHGHRGLHEPPPGPGRPLPRGAGRPSSAHPRGVRAPRRGGAWIGRGWALLRLPGRSRGGPGGDRGAARDRRPHVAGRDRDPGSDGPAHGRALERRGGLCRARCPSRGPDLCGRSRGADPHLPDDPRPEHRGAARAARRCRPGLPPLALAGRPAAALPGRWAGAGPRVPAPADDRGAAEQPQARGHELHRPRAGDRAGHSGCWSTRRS